MGVNLSKFPWFGGSRAGDAGSASRELIEAHAALGVPFGAPFGEVKKVYRAKCKELHPDVLRSKGVGEYAIAAMESELKRINEAYNTIKNSAR